MAKKLGGLHLKDCPPGLQEKINAALAKEKLTHPPVKIKAWIIHFLLGGVMLPPNRSFADVQQRVWKHCCKFPKAQLEVYEIELEE